jgi:hypothetical protein
MEDAKTPKWVLTAVGVLVLLAVFAADFQLFFRYQYVETGGVQWRLDRLTSEKCHLVDGSYDCSPLPPSTSTSTSTSTSANK